MSQLDDRSRRVALLAVGLLIMLTGCTGAADSGPELANEPPYWCEIVPKKALAEVQGLDAAAQGKLSERVSRHLFDTDIFGCSVEEDDDPKAGISVRVLRGSEISKELSYISTRFEHDRVTELPSEMGDGGVSLYTGWVHWSCADQAILIYIVVGSVAVGPEKSEPYIVPLLRVSQERYAQLAKCSVRPPPKKQS